MTKNDDRIIELEIVVPVYNEGKNIISLLEDVRRHVETPYRVMICYDFDEDDTLSAIEEYEHKDHAEIVPVKNTGRGPNMAVVTGLRHSTAPFVLTHMADDDFNADIIDKMIDRAKAGASVVAGSRFLPGGCMDGCVWYKKMLTVTANISMFVFGRAPIRDATNGFKLFTRELLDRVELESTEGFTYAIELVAKAHRLGLRLDEIPAKWYERREGESRFQIIPWIKPYLRWYFFTFATTWLRRGPETMKPGK
ncbi:MAG: glycosyltransferase [Rhodospirillales bacterium]|nr:glycosyltransferase [Rhodospirillales bacterium]